MPYEPDSTDLQGIVFPIFAAIVTGMGLLHVVRTAWLWMDPLVLWTWVPMHTPFSLTLASLVKVVVFLAATLIILIAALERGPVDGCRLPLLGLLILYSGFMLAYAFISDAMGSYVIARYQEIYGMYGEREDLVGYDAPSIRNALEIINAHKTK